MTIAIPLNFGNELILKISSMLTQVFGMHQEENYLLSASKEDLN